MTKKSPELYFEDLSRVDRVYYCISRILSIPEEEARAHYPTKIDDFKRFQEICSFMAEKHEGPPKKRSNSTKDQPDERTYPRWLTQLLIEVPYEDLSVNSLDKWKITKAANSNANIPYKDLHKLINFQQKMRKKLADKLYECLPEKEKEDFGHLLRHEVLDLTDKTHIDNNKLTGGWYQKDIRCAELIYTLESLFNQSYLKIEERLHNKGIHEAKANIAHKAFLLLYQSLQYLVRETRDSHDSLFAKLLFNMAINRAILEIDYQQYLANIAEENSIKLVQFLQKQMDVLPTVHSSKEIIPYLEEIFAPDHFGSDYSGTPRPIKTDLIRVGIMERAETAFVSYLENNSSGKIEFIQGHWNTQNLFLMALFVAWSYVTQAKIVTHQEGINHPVIEIMSGRRKKDKNKSNKEDKGNFINHIHIDVQRYHNIQYGLFFYSGQLNNLSELELREYASNQSAYRVYKRRISSGILKNLTLSKFCQLYEVDYRV
ncbi:MAG: hypothetical protein NC211_07095 [Alistipes senegalensis]|nr:hypothetical protein [Oxalobacter formigenes]MCM1281576.1 hypothetical protein [Alistipes senegalensis]